MRDLRRRPSRCAPSCTTCRPGRDGVFEDYDGWVWTLNLGDALGEYEALRSDLVM